MTSEDSAPSAVAPSGVAADGTDAAGSTADRLQYQVAIFARRVEQVRIGGVGDQRNSMDRAAFLLLNRLDWTGAVGVKALAQAIIPQLESPAAPKLEHDSSTNNLIQRYRQMKSSA